MKNKFSLKVFMAAALIAAAGCQKNEDITANGTNDTGSLKMFPVSADYTATVLVSDVAEYNPQRIDPILVNAWGMAFSSFGSVWVSAAETHVSTVYDAEGNDLLPAVTIPFETDGGNPTGQVFNNTSVFNIPVTGEHPAFIFVTEQGTVTAWVPGNASAVTVANRSDAEAVYKGVEIVNVSGQWMLYATDFHNAHVDIFDQNFNFVGNSMFVDPDMA